MSTFQASSVQDLSIKMNMHPRGALLSSDARTNTSLYEGQNMGQHIALKIRKVQTVEELSQVFKSAIRQVRGRSTLPGLFKSMHAIRTSDGIEIKRVIEKPEYESDRGLLREDKENIVESEGSRCGQVIYQNLETICQIEMHEGTTYHLGRSAVVKVSQCGFSNINHCIYEAITLGKAQSHYSSKLMDVALGKGTKSCFEVILVLERLELNLKQDLQHRGSCGNPYTETELTRILRDISAALLFGKLQVRPR